MMSPWYQRIFPTRLAPHRQAVQEFITTRQGYRLATSTGGVLTGRGTICRLQRCCGSYDPEQDQSGLDSGLLLDSRQAGRYHLRRAWLDPIKARNGGFGFLPLSASEPEPARFQPLSRFLASVCYK
jgi:hypothetical protein